MKTGFYFGENNDKARKCKCCGKEIETYRRKDALYCSPICRRQYFFKLNRFKKVYWNTSKKAKDKMNDTLYPSNNSNVQEYDTILKLPETIRQKVQEKIEHFSDNSHKGTKGVYLMDDGILTIMKKNGKYMLMYDRQEEIKNERY